MEFKLVIQDDEGKTMVVSLRRDEITIGRMEGNTIRLTERNVSRRHARILRNNGEVHIEDLGSYNGIRVNNARIAERVSLRVSDQVQIGDYKLYLKAEDGEPFDESRTTPGEPSPLVTAVATAPGAPAPGAPAQVPAAPPITGGQNSSAIAMLDTQPGHPVPPVAAAAVATLGHGKLVVLSSNFAGKEWELSRPQMIIGRTEENDIVINHRSISRNHAKLVREPATGRYTISDLQSSNGVRVNGSDYGKVELRRGDVIDLGHVRLRFIEPGEDFVFARDAVITDVPEIGGSRRGMLVVVLAVVVVVVAGVVIYTLRSSGRRPAGGQLAPGTDPSGELTPGSGEPSLAEQPSSPSPTAAASPGSSAAAPPAAPPDATTAKAQKAARCAELEAQKDWQKLRDCASELAALGDKAKSEEFRVKALKETASELAAGKVQQALADGNLGEAQKQLGTIGAGSVYFAATSDAFRSAEAKAIEEARRKAQDMASARDCAGLKRFQEQTRTSSTSAVSNAVAAVKCADRERPSSTGASSPNPVKQPAGGGSLGSRQSSGCDTMNVEDLMKQAENQYAAGFAPSALKLVTRVLACKQDVRMYRLAALYACAAHDAASAKVYFAKIPSQSQSGIIQRCQQEGISLP